MLVPDLVIGALASLPFAVLASRVGRVSRAGAATGVLFGAISYAAFYLAGLAVLGTALILTLVTSRMRRHQAQSRPDDDRGVSNVVANCLVGILGAVLHLAADWRLEPSALWFVTAIAAGASDTVASEIGRAYGGQPRSILTRQLVAPGTPGAISTIGTLANWIAAALIAAPAVALWLLPARLVAAVVVASWIGSLVESFLATTLETRGLINNDILNVVNTATAAGLAVSCWA